MPLYVMPSKQQKLNYLSEHYASSFYANDLSCDGIFYCRLETIDNLSLATSGVDDRFHFAHKFAADLFLFMTSFSPGENRLHKSLKL